MDVDQNDGPVDGSGAKSAAAEYQAHVEAKRKNCIEKMRHVMEQMVPERIKELDRLIDSGHFDVSDCDSGVAGGIPVPKRTGESAPIEDPDETQKPFTILFPNGLLSTNTELQSFSEKIKGHLMDQARVFLDLSNHLTLIVPKMESGNVFGLMILGSFFVSLVKFINESQADLSMVMKYNRERTNIIANISKFPHCEDVRKTLEDYDDEHTTRFQMYAETMRMRYCLIHDHYLKNKERIQEPVPESPIDMF